MLHNTKVPELAELPNGGIDKIFLFAVLMEDYPEMEMLLLQGADINHKYGEKYIGSSKEKTHPDDTPLTWAVREKNVRLTKFLLDHKANTEVSVMKFTPLMHASLRHELALMELLLEANADPNASNSAALWMVCMGAFDERGSSTHNIINTLLKKGCVAKPSDIEKEIKYRTVPSEARSLIGSFYKVWGSQTSSLSEQAYKKGAAAGAFSKSGVGSYIGSFLNTIEGRRLACVSKAALEKARKEEDAVILSARARGRVSS